MGKFLLGLIGLFFVELWVLIKVGSSIGPLTTLILMVLAAMLGGQLVRSQGVMTLFNLQKRMQAGEAPGGELLQGIWLALAGFLFIFPGFVSDVFSLLLLQPTIRRLLTLFVVSRLARPAARAVCDGLFTDFHENARRARAGGGRRRCGLAQGAAAARGRLSADHRRARMPPRAGRVDRQRRRAPAGAWVFSQ